MPLALPIALAVALLAHAPEDVPDRVTEMTKDLPEAAAVDEAPALLPPLELPPGPGTPERLASHLAHYYRVNGFLADETVQAAFAAATENGLDPLLVLAVIGVESSFDPAARSPKGALGLMQIIPRYHLARLDEHGGEAVLLEPEVNVALGARILSEYVARHGSLAAGLQRYNGAAGDDEARYAQRVLSERERLNAVVAGMAP